MNAHITNGQDGGIVIPDGNTTAYTFDPPVKTLKALGVDVVFDTVVGNLTGPTGTGNGLDGETLGAGDVVVGIFTSVKLVSGTCICYN